MSRNSKLIKNTIILAIGTFFPKFAIFITLPILTSRFTKEEYGTYDLVVTLVSLVLPIATLQIQSAAFRFLIDVQNDTEKRNLLITNIYIFVSVTSAAVLILAFFLLNSQPIELRTAICLYYLFDIFSNVSRQIARGLSKNFDYAVSSIISGAGQITFIFIFVVGLNQKLVAGIYALATAELMSALYLIIKLKIYKSVSFSKLSKQTISDMLKYSWPMVPNSLSHWIIHASDRLIITFFMGTEANAVYSVAYKIPSILSLAQTTFNMSWQESTSLSVNDSDVASYYSSTFKALFSILAGGVALLLGATPILFHIFIKGDYAQSYPQIPILFMGMFFLCLSTFWGGIFVSLKKTKQVGSTTVIAAVVNLILHILLINFIGLYAGSISSLAAYVVMCLLRAIEVQKYVRINYDLKHVLIIGVLLTVQCIICAVHIVCLDILNLIVGILMCIILNRKLLAVIYSKLKLKLK